MSGNSQHSVTSAKGGNNVGDETFLESHVLSILPLSPFLDTPTTGLESVRLNKTQKLSTEPVDRDAEEDDTNAS